MKNLHLFIAFIALSLYAIFAAGSEIQALIYGPGIKRNVQLPVRYFFVQTVDKATGENYTVSPGSNVFTVTFESASHKRLRLGHEVLDLKNGSFLVRYRTYASYDEVTVSIVDMDGVHLASSPYTITDVFPDECDCPGDLDEWLTAMECPPVETQIVKDLELFPAISVDSLGDEAFARHPQWSLVHYSLINNKLYRRTSGRVTDFKVFSDVALLSITRKVTLPDMELVINLGDWPVEKKDRYQNNPLPIMSWCGSESTNDIVWPTYDLIKSTLESMRGIQLDILGVMGNTGPVWSDKKAKAFFRGRDSRQERLDLVRLYRNMTDLFDVGLTNFFFFDYKPELYGPKNKPVSFFKFFEYKYQLNIDGTVAAYRLPYLLAGDSVVFKQQSEYYEHFYHKLEPYTHFIPMNSNISNIEELVKWATDNDSKVKEIARNGQLFAVENLLPQNLYCYIASLLMEYSKRQVGVPRIRKDMELIPQPADSPCPCKTVKHEEL